MRTLSAFGLHLLLYSHGEGLVCEALQRSAELLPVGAYDLYGVANVDFVLAANLERLPNASRAYLQLKVFFVTIKSFFDVAAESHAVFNPHSVLVVNFHNDAVVGTNAQVSQKIVLSFEPLFYETLDGAFFNLYSFVRMFYKEE